MTEPGLREGALLAELEGMLSTLSTLFTDAGFEPVQPAHLFPAETLLDLYGEDIRARAFLFPDPSHGDELCLRPDFTVPVAMAHGVAGWERAGQYCYQGPVFRQQQAGQDRPVEYIQAGIEDFGDTDAAKADARVFSLIHRGLDALSAPPHQTTLGDLGIIFGLLDTLEMPGWRRHQLRRHLWRSRRFHELLHEFGRTPAALSSRRVGLLEATRECRIAELVAAAGDAMGSRDLPSILHRAEALAAAESDPVMPSEHVALIEAVLDLECPADQAPERLEEILGHGGIALPAALHALSLRLEALAEAGFDLGEMVFDASFGRNLEYYDGFVFEVVASDRPEAPPLAGGGRYDAITARLGADQRRPAVGGIIRPEAVREAQPWR